MDVLQVRNYVEEHQHHLAFIFSSRYGLPFDYFQEAWAKLSLLEQWAQIKYYVENDKTALKILAGKKD